MVNTANLLVLQHTPSQTRQNAFRQGHQVERLLLAIPGQAPTKERGKDRLLRSKETCRPGQEQGMSLDQSAVWSSEIDV